LLVWITNKMCKSYRVLYHRDRYTVFAQSIATVRYTGSATQGPLHRVRYTGSATQGPLHRVRYTGSATQGPLHRVRAAVVAAVVDAGVGWGRIILHACPVPRRLRHGLGVARRAYVPP
jgi:hypothetical protein